MRLGIERFGFGRDSTLGELTIEGKPVAFTIEDERRRIKVPGETCIPAGVYRLKFRAEGGMHPKYAKRFPAFHMGMLWLQDVPGFEYVYLHCGNDDDDSEGCPLIATTPIVKPDGEFAGSESARAYEKVYRQIIDGWDDDVRLTIWERESA